MSTTLVESHSKQPSNSYVIAIAGSSGAGKTTVVKLVTTLLEDAVSFYFDDYGEYPENVTKWLEQGANLKQWSSPRLVENLGALKSGKSITLSSDLAHSHRVAIGDCEFKGVLEPAKYIIVDEPFGRERPGLDGLVDYVVGLDTPLDLALARKLLRDIEYHFKGIYSGEIAKYLEGVLRDYQFGTRELYLVAYQVVLNHSDMIIDGTKSAEEIAVEIVNRVREQW